MKDRERSVQRPTRFEVRFATLRGVQFTYRVVTFLGPEKATALAALEHDLQVPDSEIFAVRVVDLGVPEFVDGQYDIDGDELMDRQEW